MKWMKWIDTMVAVAVVALVIMARGPAVVWATTANCGNVPCGSGFNGSYHDFVNGPGAKSHGTVTFSGANNTTTTATVGQCTLCHTPHMAIQTNLLWNHHLSNNTQFTWEANAQTMAGTPYAVIANTWGGATTKCLSCHDGSVSPSTINWFEGSTPLAGSPSCPPGATSPSQCSHVPEFGFNGSMQSTHPVAMPYPCNGNRNTYNASTTGAQIVAIEFAAQPAAPIRLYQDNGTGFITRAAQGGCSGTNNGMECTSCHDIHNAVGQTLEADLLRGYMSGSSQYICTMCHTK